MKIIGITGPTGAGKTTALRALKPLNVCILDADAVYHELLTSCGELKMVLVERFGVSILDADGQVGRKKLGEVVFGEPAALKDLNEVTNRFILDELFRRIHQAQQQGKCAVVIDAIRLIESGIGEKCDATVGILAPVDLRIRRIMARECIPLTYARKRVEAQAKDDFFRTYCTCILENNTDDTPEAFGVRALELFRNLLQEKEKLEVDYTK